jgi:hypothetical protein
MLTTRKPGIAGLSFSYYNIRDLPQHHAQRLPAFKSGDPFVGVKS